MVTSIKAHRDETGLSDGELLIDGILGAGAAEQVLDAQPPGDRRGRGLVPGRHAGGR